LSTLNRAVESTDSLETHFVQRLLAFRFLGMLGILAIAYLAAALMPM
jgi:hypothetical protein